MRIGWPRIRSGRQHESTIRIELKMELHIRRGRRPRPVKGGASPVPALLPGWKVSGIGPGVLPEDDRGERRFHSPKREPYVLFESGLLPRVLLPDVQLDQLPAAPSH